MNSIKKAELGIKRLSGWLTKGMTEPMTVCQCHEKKLHCICIRKFSLGSMQKTHLETLFNGSKEENSIRYMHTMQCIQWHVHSAMYTMQCIQCNVSMRCIQCSIYNVMHAMHTVQCIQCNAYNAMYTMQYIQWSNSNTFVISPEWTGCSVIHCWPNQLIVVQHPSSKWIEYDML